MENINNVELNKNERIKNSLKLPGKWNHRVTNEFLNRFYYSIPIQNEEEYFKMYEFMDFKKFCNLTKQRLIASIDNLQNDIVGNIKSGNLHTSLYCMRELFILFSKVVIYDNNELIDRDKWALPKLFSIVEKNEPKLDFIKKIYNEIFIYPKLDDKILIEIAKKLFLEMDNYILNYEEDLWI